MSVQLTHVAMTTTKLRCGNPNCTAPVTDCLLLHPDYQADCPDWLDRNKTTSNEVKEPTSHSDEPSIAWHGAALQPHEIESISRRSTPWLIGLIGQANAGKSSYLGMLYTLLLNGYPLAKHCFAGSQTLLAWEGLAATLRFGENNTVTFPAPTPSTPGYYSLLHLALKSQQGQLRDLLFADASGEVFNVWAVNRNDENAESARWIYQHADAIMFFINCDDLAQRRAAAVKDIRTLANRVREELNERPLVVVWSKADQADHIYAANRQDLETLLASYFPAHASWAISNAMVDEPDPLCHEHNRYLLDGLLSQLAHRRVRVPTLTIQSTDPFLNFRG